MLLEISQNSSIYILVNIKAKNKFITYNNIKLFINILDIKKRHSIKFKII